MNFIFKIPFLVLASFFRNMSLCLIAFRKGLTTVEHTSQMGIKGKRLYLELLGGGHHTILPLIFNTRPIMFWTKRSYFYLSSFLRTNSLFQPSSYNIFKHHREAHYWKKNIKSEVSFFHSVVGDYINTISTDNFKLKGIESFQLNFLFILSC